MESLALNIVPLACFVVLFIVEFIFFHKLNRVGSFQKLLLRYQSFIDSQLGFSNDLKSEVAENQDECVVSTQRACSSNDKIVDDVIDSEDVEKVMEKLGLFCTSKDETLKESFSPKEISNLFEEKEPSLEELKEAFDVFDENKDGFIDAQELHRVLSILGLKEGLKIEHCRMMIATFGENQDDRVEFKEFVKVMENGFC